MAYIIHRIAKHHSITKIKNHIERDETKQTENLNRVCRDRTHENKFLEPRTDIDDNYIKTKYRARKNAVLAIEGLYTASPEFFKGQPKWMYEDFFDDCLEWHKKTYGDKIISAVIHYDETTPHLHILSIPERDGKLKAKEITGDQNDCARRQTEIAREIGEKHGLQRGEKKSLTAHKNQVQYNQELLAAKERKIEHIIDKLEDWQAELDKREEQIINMTVDQAKTIVQEYERQQEEHAKLARNIDKKINRSHGWER